MLSGLLHDQPIKREVATVRTDSLGCVVCADCTPRGVVEWETEITGPYSGHWENGGPAPTHPFNLCDRCGRNPWEARREVVRTGTLEFVPCKIF